MGRAPGFLIALALTSCNAQDNVCPVVPGPRPPGLPGPKTAAEWNQRVDDCIARWGTRIAPADGSISELAFATVGGCVDAIDFYVSEEFKEARTSGYAIEDTYEKRVAERRADARQLAAFYVAAAKANGCKLRK